MPSSLKPHPDIIIQESKSNFWNPTGSQNLWMQIPVSKSKSGDPNPEIQFQKGNSQCRNRVTKYRSRSSISSAGMQILNFTSWLPNPTSEIHTLKSQFEDPHPTSETYLLKSKSWNTFFVNQNPEIRIQTARSTFWKRPHPSIQVLKSESNASHPKYEFPKKPTSKFSSPSSVTQIQESKHNSWHPKSITPNPEFQIQESNPLIMNSKSRNPNPPIQAQLTKNARVVSGSSTRALE